MVFCDEGWTDVTSRGLTAWSMATDNESAEVRYRGWKLYRISYSFRGSRHTTTPQPRAATRRYSLPSPFPVSSLAYPPSDRHAGVTAAQPRSSSSRLIAKLHLHNGGIRRGDDKSLNYEYRLIHDYAFGRRDMDDTGAILWRGRAIPPRSVGECAKTCNYRTARTPRGSIRSAIT